ncbi:DNA adenine methylase family protein, partial [Campylobacter jejuni subsp. jejuni 305]
KGVCMKNNTDKFLKTSTLTKPTRTTLKAPFAWVGGKNYLAKEIIALMPEHKSYIEVFGGALSVFYQKSASKIEVINDINDELINLHLCIRNKPQSLANVLNSMIISRKIFHMLKNKEIKPRNDLERAAFYFYLISTSFGSSMGQFAMNKQRAPKRLCRDFSLHTKRLKNASIENKSFEYILKEYDYNEALFYLDPPYVGTENYYKNTGGFGLKEHELLCNLLKNIKGKFMLSYNDCELIRELYKDFNIKELKVRYSLNNNVLKRKESKELLIMNF